MKQKAFELFVEAWNQLKAGDFYSEQNNTQIEFMLKSLWKSEYHNQIKNTILNDLPDIFERVQKLDRPAPIIHILVSLNDNNIKIHLQELSILDWIKSNASEPSTFQLLNLVETFGDRGLLNDTFIKTIIKHIRAGMNTEMVKALGYMLYIKHPEVLELLLKQFLSLPDKSIMKEFVQMAGKRAVLMLATLVRPGDIKKILG